MWLIYKTVKTLQVRSDKKSKSGPRWRMEKESRLERHLKSKPN